MKLSKFEKEIIKGFRKWLKEHETACIEWHGNELLLWVEAEDIRSFGETFGIQDDNTLACTLVSIDCFCFKVKDFMGGYGFDMTAILRKDREDI